MATVTVFSIVLVAEVAADDDDDGGNNVTLYRVAVPHGDVEAERTPLQRAVVRLQHLGVSSFTLLTHREKSYKESSYNTLSEQMTAALDDAAPEDDEDEEDDEEEDEDDFDADEPKAKVPKVAREPVPYVMPVVTKLTANEFTADMARAPRAEPYKQAANERHVFMLVRSESIQT